MAQETFLSGKWCLIIHKQMYTRALSLHNSLKQKSLSIMLEIHFFVLSAWEAWVHNEKLKMKRLRSNGIEIKLIKRWSLRLLI